MIVIQTACIFDRGELNEQKQLIIPHLDRLIEVRVKKNRAKLGLIMTAMFYKGLTKQHDTTIQ